MSVSPATSVSPVSVVCKRLVAAPLLLSALAGPAASQALKVGNAADAPRLTPAQQQAAFVLPDGFSIELVTSEVEGTEKPVALNFDDAGRLWTMTATEYPLDTNDPQHAEVAKQKWRDGGRDRVLVIDAPLGPGPHRPRIFADGLVMPMSVLPHGDGAIVAHGPEMLRLRDTDGDGRADERRVLLRGFGVQDSHTMAHQLMWLPDGSILTVQGVLDSGGITDAAGVTTAFNYGKFAAFRPDGTHFRLIGAGLNNTWGVLLQRNGRMWVQEANSFDHSIAPFEEGVHFHGWNEEPYLQNAPWQPGVGEIDLGSTGLSGLTQSEDRAGGFPPEWQQRLLIANAVSGTINSVTAEARPEGGWTAARGPDLVSCTDRRFRPVHIAFGPDACLYIVDWYNPVISHNEVARDHPARDKSSGRIWRVRHTTQTNRHAPNVQAAPDAALVTHLRSPNTWEMRAAWRQIVERQATSLIPELTALVTGAAESDDVRIHAVWCLAGLRQFDATVWTTTVRSCSPELAFELVRALRLSPPPAGEARVFLHAAAARPEQRVHRELARYLQTATDVGAPDLAAVLPAHAPVAEAMIKGVQGDTLPWPAYEQAFLNSQLERLLDLQPAATESLAATPGLMTRLPGPVRTLLERRGYAKRFEDGSIATAGLDHPSVRSAAFACAESSPRAAELLREFSEKSPDPWALAQEILNSSTLTPAALRTFAGPLALRLMAATDPEMWPSALDLAAHACTAADSARFAAQARRLLAERPALRLPAVRSALAAGVREAAFYSEIAQSEAADPAVRAAAWTGWFESAAAADRPAIEAALPAWAAALSAAAQTEVLSELASTTTGAHFALNHVFPALLAQDDAVLPRLADELAERVPGHGRLPEVQAVVQRQRATRTASAEKRIASLTTALTSGQLTADPAAGQPLFAGLCLTCHAAGGQGIGFAPPLDGSRQRDLSAVLTALLDPEAAVESVFRPFHVRRRDGTTLEGFLKSRDGNRATLQSMGGAIQPVNLLRAHSARHLNDHSLMPPLAVSLTDQQVADLVAWVRSLN
jgi:putative membrane-bound dehydrogenase-like protein